jgi:hypothetical protein
MIWGESSRPDALAWNGHHSNAADILQLNSAHHNCHRRVVANTGLHAQDQPHLAPHNRPAQLDPGVPLLSGGHLPPGDA